MKLNKTSANSINKASNSNSVADESVQVDDVLSANFVCKGAAARDSGPPYCFPPQLKLSSEESVHVDEVLSSNSVLIEVSGFACASPHQSLSRAE